MKAATLLFFALPAWVCVAGEREPQLLVQGLDGSFLRQSAVAVRKGGYALIPREALYGASTAMILDARGGMHPVLYVTGDNPDVGVLEVWAGLQLPPGADGSREESPSQVRADGHDSKVVEIKEAGSGGIIGRLDCNHDGLSSAPLYDHHGFLAGWHVVRVVNGVGRGFAIPLSRIEMGNHGGRVEVKDWGRTHDAAREENYQKALGYMWAEDFDGAQFYFRKAAETDSTNARIWLHLGFTEGKQGRSSEKVHCLRRAIELDPDLDLAHYHLGFQLLLNGDHDGAESEVDELQRLNSPYAQRLKTFLEVAHVDRLEKKPKGTRRVHKFRLV
jgi:Tfp pilus assembly protein PilF